MSTSHTTNYDLNQWEGTDKVLRTEFNADNAKIDAALKANADAIAAEIYGFAEVKSCYLMSGGYDLAVFIEGRTLRDVARFVSERLSTLDEVQSTATHFILKKYKIEGTVTEKEEGGRRISVTA